MGYLKLGCNAENYKNWTGTYYRSWHDIFFEKDTRGRISYISNRYRKANNKYLKFSYPKEECKFLYIKFLYILRRK